MFGLSLGIGVVSGQLIGGLLIRADGLDLDWRTCFLINVPVGLGVALLGIVFYGALGGGVPHAFRGCLVFLIVVELALAALVQLLPKAPAGA